MNELVGRGPKLWHRALKGVLIAAFNAVVVVLLDWLLPGGIAPNFNEFCWAFSLGIFCGYFFWGESR
jgi:hypothetical protein